MGYTWKFHLLLVMCNFGCTGSQKRYFCLTSHWLSHSLIRVLWNSFHKWVLSVLFWLNISWVVSMTLTIWSLDPFRNTYSKPKLYLLRAAPCLCSKDRWCPTVRYFCVTYEKATVHVYYYILFMSLSYVDNHIRLLN